MVREIKMEFSGHNDKRVRLEEKAFQHQKHSSSAPMGEKMKKEDCVLQHKIKPSARKVDPEHNWLFQ